MINKDLIEVFSEIAMEKNVERSQLASILEELFLFTATLLSPEDLLTLFSSILLLLCVLPEVMLFTLSIIYSLHV